MKRGSTPLVVICHVSPVKKFREPAINLKALVASITRSGTESIIHVLHDHETPLFRIPRKGVIEIPVLLSISEMRAENPGAATREVLLRLPDLIQSEPHPWIIVMDHASLILRNIDHLIPEDSGGEFSSPLVEFYWMPGTGPDAGASTGIWAVRSHLLEQVLTLWRKNLITNSDPEFAWSKTVAELPLKKRRFEVGEIIAPQIDHVDWSAVSSAAFVTVPDWPPEAGRRFLQSLYFGTWFGDSTGLMLNILDS